MSKITLFERRIGEPIARMVDLPPKDATEVYEQTSIQGRKIYGDRIKSIYLLGSLAHGGFSESTSDIDVAFILDQPNITETDWSNFDSIEETIKEDPALRFGRKLSLFWSNCAVLSNELTSGAFPVPRRDQGVFPPYDVLDLIQNGKLLEGEDIRNDLRMPSTADLSVAGVEFMLSYVNTDENNQSITDESTFNKLSNHDKSKLILFPARLMYTLSTGKVGDNIEAAEEYKSNETNPLINEAINQALEIRRSDTYDSHALSSAFPALADLYKRLITFHKEAMDDLGLVDHSKGLDSWLKALEG